MNIKTTTIMLIIASTLFTGCVSEALNNTEPSAGADYNATTKQKPNAIISMLNIFVGEIEERVQNTTDNAEIESQRKSEIEQQKLEEKKESLLDKLFGKSSKYNLKEKK